NVPVGVFQVSPSGRFIAGNPLFAKMLGSESVTPEFLQGIEERLFVEPRTKEAWKQLLHDRKEISNMEIRLHVDAKDRYFLQSIHPFKNAAGQLEYFEGTLHNITELKKLENELLHSQRMESIGTLAGGIAHDFNNILQIVLLNTLKLRRLTDKPENHTETIEIIKKSIQRGASLVRQLMTVARKTEVVFQDVNVNASIEELRKLLEQTFPANIEIHLQLTETPPLILADSTQLHQVLLNLCVNARDAMPNGGLITVTSKILPAEAAKNYFGEATNRPYVLVDVTDTGTGMDDAVRRRIFEPFFTTKGVGQGTGLGLAVVYGIIEQHGGYIDVESVIDKGTTFHVLLPIRNADQASARIAVITEGESLRGSGTILLVEDESDIRMAVKAILEENGYVVLTAGDGEEAVNIFDRQHKSINLVMLDNGLPKLTGWQAYLAMKKTKPDVVAIFCTGSLDPETRAQKAGAGIRAFVFKPYMPEDILRKVQSVLAGGQ
ncbi:MAG TPA: ATP-binding protein, partial [Bacteroidota bacterium]|nr:ATP-binding protein [Bacteroidota bacterium]